MDKAVVKTTMPGMAPPQCGKVRDIYDLGDTLMIVATDRISTFDVVLPTGIPDKGKVLTAMSLHWFGLTKEIVSNHLVSADIDSFPVDFGGNEDEFRGRSMLVKKATPFPVECVARGYLAGSGWREYSESGSVCGIDLPAGLEESSKLPEPIFTPATKATSGHDINISEQEAAGIVAPEVLAEIKRITLNVYGFAAGYAEERGVIIADTKFEFGMCGGDMLLIDEVLTPDSSRFWPRLEYEPGRSQDSFDKQYVRDYMESTGWDKASAPPELPDEVVAKTREKYLEAYCIITGKDELE